MAAEVNIRVKATDEASGVLKGIGGVFGNILQGAASFIAANVIQRGAQEIFQFATSSIQAASNLGETLNKTNEIFEESAAGILSWAKTAATAVGLSEQAALDAASGMAIFGKAAGLSGQDLNDFATNNVQLAADMASFFNTSVEEASLALQSAFRGESEPIRKYGVLLNEAALKEKALELGIISNTKNALTPQQKVLAANALITEQLADAQGDFARTSDGLANSQRILAAQMENVKTSLGEAFLPLVTQFVGFLSREGVPVLLNLVDRFKEWFKVIGESDITATLKTIMDTITNLFSGGGGSIGLFDTIRGFFGWLQTWWDTYGAPIKENFSKMFEGTGETFSKIVADVQPFIYEVLQKISGWMVENAPLIQAFAQVISDFWVNNLMPAITSVWNAIKPLLGGIIDLVLGLVKLVMQVATGDWAGAWNTIVETVTNVGLALWNTLVNLLDAIFRLFGTSLDEILVVTTGWMDSLIAWWTNGSTAITTGVATWWENLKANFMAGVEVVKSFIAGLWENIVNAFQTAGLIVLGLGLMFWNWILGLFGTNVNEVINYFTNLWTSIVTIFTSIWTSVTEFVGQIITTLSEWGTTVWGVVTDVWEKVKTIVSDAWTAMVETISNFLQPIIDAVTAIWDGIMETVSGWVQAAMDIGSNIIQGIADGISNGASNVVAAIVAVAQEAIAEAKAFLGIESPSTVFAGIGKNVMAGFSEGIEDESGAPINAVTNATRGIVGAVPQTASGASVAGGSAMNIVINISSPITIMDEANAVENLRKYVAVAFRQLRSEGQV